MEKFFWKKQKTCDIKGDISCSLIKATSLRAKQNDVILDKCTEGSQEIFSVTYMTHKP